MSQSQATSTTPRERRIEGIIPERSVLGATLLAIGTIVLAGFAVPELERYALLAISTVLILAFAFSREYGFAIPAGITGGVGTMVFLVTSGSVAPASVPAVVFLSLAGGFASIWLLGLAAVPRSIHPWPLVPALVLGLLGTALATQQASAITWIQAGVALALVLGGLRLVVARHTR